MTSNYKLFEQLMQESSKPGSVNSRCNQRLVVFDQLFSPEECEAAIRTFDPYPCDKGLVGVPTEDGNPDSEYRAEEDNILRDCYVTYAPRTDENAWVHERLEHAMTVANNEYWQCEITDFSQPIRMMTYEKGNHFGSLHSDHGPGDSCYRKLTAVLQASDPSSYQGGEFEIPGETMPPESKRQGSVLIFPTYLIHRAGMVTEGLRRTIIHRAIGPWFK